MNSAFISFAFSAIVSYIILATKRYHINITGDDVLSGRQRFHISVVPRVGGIGIICGIICSSYIRLVTNPHDASIALDLVLVSLPVLVGGLVEDTTKRVGVLTRLTLCTVSAMAAAYFMDAWITSLDIPFLDSIFKGNSSLSLLFSIFAIVGLTNSFNIIDGYNGLTGVVSIFILSAIGYVAFKVGDIEVMFAILVMIGGIAGFLIFNYPRGLMFLGDGGAYLIGFWISVLAILLVTRNVEVSKWFPLMVVIYPVTETLFSIFRRVLLNRKGATTPDSAHLHHLIYFRLPGWLGFSVDDKSVARNSATSPYLWAVGLVSIIPAVIFWRDTSVLRLFIFLFVLAYIIIYFRLLKLVRRERDSA